MKRLDAMEILSLRIATSMNLAAIVSSISCSISMHVYTHIYIPKQRVSHIYTHAGFSADHSSVEAVLEVFPELEVSWFS